MAEDFMDIDLPRRRRVLLTGLAFLMAGCAGRASGDVSGKVTYKGKPLTTGSVAFIPREAPPVVGRIEADGTYVAHGVPAGEVTVTVTSLDPSAVARAKGKSANDLPPEAEAAAAKASGPSNAGWFPIPDKYAHAASSDLKLTVKGGQNDYPIDLQ